MLNKILIIDDEKDFCFFLKLNLEMDNDLSVLTECDAKRGYEMAVFEKPDLIFLDLLMPGLNGFEIKKMLSENNKTKSIPVIALTAKEDEKTIDDIKNNGFTAFLIKPVAIKVLKQKIDEVLR